MPPRRAVGGAVPSEPLPIIKVRDVLTPRALRRASDRVVKRVAIVQSCYIPWKGYFDLVNSVDEFILYDDCQYTRQDWRNRNRIKTPRGTRWLTIPVTVNGLYQQRLDETEAADPKWSTRHWDIIRHAYRRAPYFEAYADEVESAYVNSASEPRLSKINRGFIEIVSRFLGITTTLKWSTDYAARGSATKRVVDLCEQAGAGLYLSGPSARAYIEESMFAERGIELRYFDYTGYPEYRQLYPPFDHNVSVLDLLFSVGPNARDLMRSFGAEVGAGE